MNRLISIFLILLSFSSIAQPGDLDLSAKLQDSLEFMVVDSLGDTITSENIVSKNFSINTFYVWENDFWHCGYLSEKPQFGAYSIDSNGIVSDQYSVILNLSNEDDKFKLWHGLAWVIHIKHNDQIMNIYVEGPGPLNSQRASHLIYLFHFNRGNYYFLDEPSMYFNDGLPITDSLISLDKTQPEKLEKLFKIYQVREKLCL